MREGYWINYRTGKTFEIHEHEDWIRVPQNAKKLGLKPALIKAFGEFKPKRDRSKFLLFLMQKAPIMRVRGHGNYVSFEYSSRMRNAPIEEIWMFGKKNAGPFTTMNIVNFATNERTQVQFGNMERIMDREGAEGIMRAAKVKMEFRPRIARDLLAIAKQLSVE